MHRFYFILRGSHPFYSPPPISIWQWFLIFLSWVVSQCCHTYNWINLTFSTFSCLYYATIFTQFFCNPTIFLPVGCCQRTWLPFYPIIKEEKRFYPFVMLQIFYWMRLLGQKLLWTISMRFSLFLIKFIFMIVSCSLLVFPCVF